MNSTDIMNRFARNLKEILTCLGKSQLEFSKQSGLTQACISRIMSGKREPLLTTAVIISKTLGCTLERLIQ